MFSYCLVFHCFAFPLFTFIFLFRLSGSNLGEGDLEQGLRWTSCSAERPLDELVCFVIPCIVSRVTVLSKPCAVTELLDHYYSVTAPR